MSFTQSLLKHISTIVPVKTAYAHCDYPCGIYDPHRAIVSALTTIRMVDLMTELETSHKNHDEEFRNSMMRAVIIKEDHAETVKKEVRILWGDYFKPDHKKKFPELDQLVSTIMHTGSSVKQTVSRDTAMELLKQVNRLAEIFWQTKGKETKRVKAPYKPEEEMVVPLL